MSPTTSTQHSDSGDEASVPDSTSRNAQTGIVRVGTAGWSYDDWMGTMYPKPMPRGTDKLEYVARYFDTVEINSTFYRPATKSMAEGWLAKTSAFPDFRFTAKLWERFTHERAEAWTRSDVTEARAAFDVLHGGGKLGALLVQFPWSFRRTDENRAWLGDVVSAFRDFPLVVEIRHESWNVPEFYEHLSEAGVGFVNVDQPLFKHSIKPSATVTSPVGYVRVHGRNYKNWFRKDADVKERYDYLYGADELKPWVERTEEVADVARETYVVMNNHHKGQAAVNAAMFESLLEHRKVEVPTTLYENYEGVLKDYAVPA